METCANLCCTGGAWSAERKADMAAADGRGAATSALNRGVAGATSAFIHAPDTPSARPSLFSAAEATQDANGSGNFGIEGSLHMRNHAGFWANPLIDLATPAGLAPTACRLAGASL